MAPCSLGDLRNRLREVDPDAGNASINSIAEAAMSLNQEGHLLLGKREDSVRRLPFDLQKQFDEGYISNFFCRGSFELKVTHQGRKHLEESEQSRAGTEPREETVSAQKGVEVQNRDHASSKEFNASKEIPRTADAVSTLEHRLRELSERASSYFDKAIGSHRTSRNAPAFSPGSPEALTIRSRFEVRGNELANGLRDLGFEIIDAASHSPLVPKADVDDLRITIRKMVSALRFREYTHYSSYVVHEEDRVYGIQPESSQEIDVSPEHAQTLFSDGMTRLREVVNDFIDPRTSGRTPVSAPNGTRRKIPRTAIILNVLIASPSDVGQERDVVTEAIPAWNAAHYQTTGTMLHAVRWETHSYPASGDRPQAILNKLSNRGTS